MFLYTLMKKLLSPGLIVALCVLIWAGCTEGDVATTEPAAEQQAKQFAELNDRIKAAPNNPDNYVERAKYFLTINDFDNALLDLDRAIKADTTRSDLHLLRGQTNFSFQHFKDAIEDYKNCLRINPDNADCHVRKAELELLFMNYPVAIANINAALRINEYMHEAYFLKGVYYKEIGDTTLAVSSYQTAIEVNPDYYDAYIAVGLLYHKSKSDLALEYYNTALALKPLSFEGLYNKAMYLQETGFKDTKRYQEALSIYAHIMELIPESELAYYNSGYIYLEYISADDNSNDTYNKAATFFTQAIERYPGYYQAYYNRGLCWESLKEYQRARNDFNKALTFQKDYTPAALGLERLDKVNP